MSTERYSDHSFESHDEAQPGKGTQEVYAYYENAIRQERGIRRVLEREISKILSERSAQENLLKSTQENYEAAYARICSARARIAKMQAALRNIGMRGRVGKFLSRFDDSLKEVLEILEMDGHSSEQALLAILTRQESKIFSLVRAGLTSQQIAGEMGISVHTVDTHRRNIRRKQKCLRGAAPKPRGRAKPSDGATPPAEPAE